MKKSLAIAPTTPPADLRKKLEQIAALLDVDLVAESMMSALEALLGVAAPAPEEVAARRQLTAGQLAAVRSTPGASAIGFLSAQSRMKRRG